MNAHTRIVAGEENHHAQLKRFLLLLSGNSSKTAAALSLLFKTVDQLGETLLFLSNSDPSRLLAAGISLPWLCKAKYRLV